MFEMADIFGGGLASKILISDEEFNGLLKEELRRVKFIIDKSHPTGYHPMAIAVGRKMNEPGKLSHINCMLAGFDMDRKNECLEQLGSVLAKQGFFVEALVFTSEAWTRAAALDADGKPKVGEITGEIVMISGLTVDRRASAIMCEVKREDGKISLPESGIQEHLYVKGGEDDKKFEMNLLESFFNGFMRSFTCKAVKEGTLGRIIEKLDKLATTVTDEKYKEFAENAAKSLQHLVEEVEEYTRLHPDDDDNEPKAQLVGSADEAIEKIKEFERKREEKKHPHPAPTPPTGEGGWGVKKAPVPLKPKDDTPQA
jgi:hypothetical protein